MPIVTFKQGEYNAENLQKIIQQGGQRIEDTYILPDGSICYLKGDSQVSMEQLKFVTPEQAKYIAEKVLEKSVQKKSEEGFGKIDLKSVSQVSSGPEIYDLEKKIREINGEVEIPVEKIERLVYTYSVEEAYQILKHMYPNGYKQVIYSDESMRDWEKTKWEKDGL